MHEGNDAMGKTKCRMDSAIKILAAILFHCAGHAGHGFTNKLLAAGGTLTVSVNDESDESPVITRMVIQRADAPDRRVSVRKTVPVGVGVVLDRSADLNRPDGP